MPKIENNSAVEQRIWFPIAIGNQYGMEVNPVDGDLTLTNVSARGHAMNVYGTHKLRIEDIWYAGSNTANTAASTLYVDSTADVYVKQWRGAGTKFQTINVNASGGRVAVSNLYTGGTAIWKKEGPGELVLGGSSRASGTTGAVEVAAGTMVVSNFTGTATTRVMFQYLTLTNSAKVVMKSPGRFRRVAFTSGCTVEMDVFDNSTAAKLGIDETLASQPDNASCVISYGGRTSTLKLRLTSGFDPTQNGSFIVYEGRNQANSMQNESAGITLQTVDLVGGRTLGTFALREGKNSQNSANLTAIWVDYTKPAVAPTVTTPTAASISGTGATLGAKVTDNGGGALTGGGVVYSSTASTPTVGGSGCTSAALASAPTVGTAFTKAVSSLTANTLYYYRGYAVNSAGTGYSAVGQFRTTATAPSAPTGLTVTQPATSDTGLHVSWTAGTGSAGTVVVMYTSDPTTAPTARTTYTGNAAYGSAPSALGGKVVYVGNGTSVDVTGLSAGTRYYVRAYGYKGTSSATAALNSLAYSGAATANGYTLAGQPTGAPTSLSVTVKTSSTLTVGWTKGAGSSYTLVVARQANAPTGTDPADGTEYDADAEYGDGDALLSGYVVYAGNGNSVEVTGLTAGTRYYFWAYSFNGTGVSPNYYTSSHATANGYTLAEAPTAQGTAELTTTGTTTATVHYSRPASGSAGIVLVMKAGSAPTWTPAGGSRPTGNAAFGSGDQVATGEYAVYANTGGNGAGGATLNVTGLSAGTHYYVRAYAYTGGANTYAYNTSSAGSAVDDGWTWTTAPASVGTISGAALGSSRAKLTWSKAGSESGVLVVVVTSGTPAPSGGTTYTGTGTYGPSGGGSALGNGYVVYRGTSAQTDYLVTGLSPSTSYTAYLFPYNVGSDDATVNYGPSATATFSTGAATGPAVTAAGVDANGMTMYWNAVGGASAYDVEATGIGTANVPFSEQFTTAKGWASASEMTGMTKTVNGRTWTFNHFLISTSEGRIYPDYNDSTEAWVELPPLTGVVTNISVQIKANSGDYTAGYWLEFYENGAWVQKALFSRAWPNPSRTRTFIYAQPFIAKGLRVRLRLTAEATMNIYDITVQGGNPGEGLKGRTLPVVGLSSGNAVTLSASQAGAGDYGNATVMAGVVPGDVDVDATWNSLTFTWDAPAVGSCVGYEVETTEDDAGWASDVVCEGETLSSSSYSTAGWKYNGVTASGSSGSVRTAPTYNNGQCLVGAAGIGMESKAFDIAGATELELKYRVCAWNLSGASPGTWEGKVNVGRIEAYYQIDGGAWHFLGSARPSSTNDNYYTDVTNRLTEGMLNGRTVAFKLIAPNAEGNGGTYLRGAYIQALRIHKVSALEGDYTSPEDTDVLEVGEEEFTISGLSASSTRHFRVRALQGTDIDHITARSVWVEATGETGGFTGPTPSVEGTGRHEVTASWAAYDGEDAGDYNISYKVQLTGCASGGEPEEVSACPASGRADGSSTTDWTYQRAYSGSKASSYPKYESPWHKLWGQYSSTTVYPGLESPEMDLTGYEKGYVEFSHNFCNQVTNSEVALYYKVGDGGWTKWADTPRATTATSGSATKRNIALPDEVIGQTRVKVKLVAWKAVNYKVVSGETTNYYAQGASVFGARVMAQGAGGGDYTCSYTSDEYTTTGTSYTFNAETLAGDSHLTGLMAGSNYYVHVQTVLTPKADGAATTSEWSEDGNGTTAAPQLPPAEVWVDEARQQHLTVAWDAADGADENTQYRLQLSSCQDSTWTSVGVQPSSTNADLDVDDDWLYVGGGSDVTAGQKTYITGRDEYPAYAGSPEYSQVLAGDNSPGLESVEFSTVGASWAKVAFRHGRWYNEGALSSAPITVSYSTDGGESWTDVETTTYNDVPEYATKLREIDLPDGALGKSRVKVRLEARSATVSGGTPVGCAVRNATVTMGGAVGDYDTCLVRDVAGLSYDQLSLTLGDLTNNTTYYFRVAASDGTQYGGWVNGMGKTLAPPSAPDTAPWATAIGRHTMTIQWVAGAGAETYTLEVYTNAALSVLQERFTGVVGTEQKVTGLDPDKTYWFRVRSHADGTSSTGWSATGNAKTVTDVSVTGLRVEDILETSMTLKWDYVGGTTYTLHWGPTVTNGATDSREERIVCPAKTLERSDAGNGWFYLGGNGDYPAYWTSSGNPTNDQGHALIYATGGKPAMQSRWFSTYGATNATVEFLHGRFNAGADSTVLVQYSVDGGASWATAGTADSTAATNPSVARAILLPQAALGRRSVAVRLTATGASGTKGAHLKDVQVVVRSGSTGAGTEVGNAALGSTGSYPLTGLTKGTRYWFEMTAAEAGDTATAETTAATRTKTTGALKSQGFEGVSAPYGVLDTTAWGYTIKYNDVGTDTWRAEGARQSTDPKVEVVADENPLYGDRALRMSGSTNAAAFGVVEFDNVSLGAGGAASVTVPFASRNLASGENLWFSYSTDNGITWKAPVAKTTNRYHMAKIGMGGSDVINQSWPYNHGSNTTTRPQGDAYVFETNGITQIKIRVAFCGNARSANHYYYLDGVTVKRLPGTPTGATAVAQEDGSVLLGWTPPAGQSVVILRGRDERHVPQSPIDLDNLPSGYELVTQAGGSPYFANGTTSFYDREVTSGWKYYYYFYGAMDNGDGTYSLSTECATANDVVKGMVTTIASQGWDGWDVHPWGYKKGRVTNPGARSDGGWWKTNGMNNVDVAFLESWETDARDSTGPSGQYYADYYGTGLGATDADRTNQLGITSKTNYYGDHSFRLSGGGSYWWAAGNLSINTNNAAVQFDNVDLSGYKNVQFSMHIAATNLGLGGDDLHVAISTNGGTDWIAVSSTNAAQWEVVPSSLDYGLEVIDGNHGNGGDWDFYFESFEPVEYTYNGNPATSIPTPEGNPYVLHVPDSVTQMMVRVMFYDSNGGSKRKMSYFIDEVRLTGDVALETPHPTMENITSNSFTVAWDPIEGASTYDVRVTKCEAAGDDAVLRTESFVLNLVTNGWTTNTTGSATLSSGAAYNHTGSSGYGLIMGGNNTELTSPEIGAMRQVSFWGKTSSANSNSKLLVQVSEDGTAWETVTNYVAAGNVTPTATQIASGSWVQKTVDLPHRQWARVRFLMQRSGDASGNFYIDDIRILGGGDYDTGGCMVKEVTGVTGTSQGFTNGVGGVTIVPGTNYFVEVKAHGTLAGNPTHSSWGETGDYTAGDFHAVADGFEMVRLTWAAASGGILVMAVPEGYDYSDVTAPTNTAVGGINGKGVVLANQTAAQSGRGLEHVRPYGSRTEDYEAKYVVYWKHGSYWEGRLETSVVLGTYVAQVAEAFAYTNGTAMTATGKQTYLNSGKGWATNWYVDQKPAEWNAGTTTRNASGLEGLLETNQLWGAGGNMIALYPGGSQGTQKAYLKRELKTALPAGTEFWGMFTMRITRNGAIDRAWAGMKLLDADGNAVAVIGKLYREDGQKYVGIMNGDGSKRSDSYTIGAQTNTYIFKYDGNNMYLRVVPWASTSNPQWATTASAPSGAQWNAVNGLSMGSLAAIKYVAIEAENCTSEYDVWLGDVYFDEIRLGATWEELVGKQTEPPLPVTHATAWADGNELVRIAWQYAGGLTNGTVINPLADGVRIYAKEGTGEGEWVEIYKGSGTNATPAKDAWSRWDHVVQPGSTHQYKVEAYASSRYTNSVTATNRTVSPETYDVSTGLYGETEYLETMSYTNNTGYAAGVMKGGHGFGDTPSAWTLQSDNTAVWTNVNPETAQAAVHITNNVSGSRPAVGNVLMAKLGDLQKAGIERQLGGDAWCGGAGQAFYVAFRMAYQWGNEAGRRAGMRLTDTNLKYVEIGKGLGDGEGFKNRFGVTATADGSSYSTGWTTAADSMRGFGDAGNTNAFLVVAKIYWTAANRADIRAGHFAIGDAAHPATLPGDETNMTWTATYSNAVISNVRKLELIAQSETSGTIGSAYFDEIRFGTTWEDIVGATEPEDVWTDGLGVEEDADGPYYKGDFAAWKITSKPHGPKQSAWVALARDNAFTTSVSSNSTTWLRKEPSGTNWHSVWMGNELQFTGTGTWYGGGVVKGELVTVKSWERPAAWGYRWNQYTVADLPDPTKTNNASADPEVFQGDAKLGLAWAPATVGGRTFPEVMIVRFPNDAAAWAPADGTVYMKGASAGAGTVVYRGTNETTLVDKGLGADTWYRYQFYTVNNSHYSPGVSVSMNTSTNVPAIEIDGDPNDWVGEPSEVKNSSTTSQGGEWIWTDKVGDGRKDIAGAYDADITEFRIKVDATNVYFMARLHCLTNPAYPYIAVGIATNVDATQLALTGNETGENWLGDEANTFLGGNLFSPASLHYADIQMTVHQVSGTWQIELFKKDGSSWYGPGGVGDVSWTVASSAAGAEDPCIEWKLHRSDLGLDFGSVTPARFTVASFVNSGGWNNDVVGTTKLSDGTSYAVDTLAIAPWGVNDKDLALTAWDEGLKNNNAEYWFDIWFGPTALHNASPSAPALQSPPNNATNVSASPTMTWDLSTDGPSEESSYRGFVVGYLVEVSTNELFNGLEGTTENGPVSCRVNVCGATNLSYRYVTDSREYWWRVRARDNSGALSAPTPWHYVVSGKTDNEGPEPRLLYVGTNVTAFLNNTGGYRDEQERSGDATSVLDSELENGGHDFGFVIEWYDINGVYATNHMHDQLSSPNPGGFAFNILDVHSDGTPYGRVSPNWDLVIVDRAATNSNPSGVNGKPANEQVGSHSLEYVWPEGDGLVLPTDDGGTETVQCWYIDGGLDNVFHNDETRCDGNFGQILTNYVVDAFSIGNYRTSLDIYLTVSAEDGCTNGGFTKTEWYTPPVYDSTGSAGSYETGPIAGAHGSVLSSGWCADFPHPERNITTNRLLHIHVRDNDTIPPTASTAKWRTAATNEAGEALLPMVAVATGTTTTDPWDPTWDNLDRNGLTRLPTYDGQGKTLQWQLTDGDVAENDTWLESKKLNFFFNVYDEYLHSGMQTNTVDGIDYVKTISESPLLKRTNRLESTGMILGPSGSVWTNWAKYTAGLSDNLREGGSGLHGLGTDPNTVLAWTYDATQTNVEALLGASELLMDSTIGTNAAGEQLVVTNALKLFAWDSDNNAPGDQEGAELEFGQLIFTDDDATAPEAVGFTSFGTGTNFTHFGDVAKWTFSTNASGSIVTTTNPLMRAIAMSPVVTGRVSSASSSPDSDGPETVKWNSNKNAIYLQGNMNADAYRAENARYFLFKVGGNGTTVWRSDMLAFYNRVSPTGPTKFALTMQGAAGISKPAASGNTTFSDDWGRTTDANSTLTVKSGVSGYNRVVHFEPTAGGVNSSATLTSPAFSCKDISSLVLEFAVGRLAAANGNTTATKLVVDYGVASTASGVPSSWIAVTNFWQNKNGREGGPASAWGSTVGTAEANHTDVLFDLFSSEGGDASLKGKDKWVTFRFVATGLGGTTGSTKSGFGVVDPKVTAGDAAGSTERLLGTVEVEKTIAAEDKSASGGDAEENVGSYANTETDVILSFDGQVVGTGTNLVTFRLYGYGATRLDANTGEVKTDYTQNGTWAIKNLYLHGTATEPKHSEVTDYDIAKGAWTNRLEVMDGAMGGYDTVRSGLWVKDDGASANEEVPSFRILYPTYYNGTTHSYPNGTSEVVTESNLIMRAAASATFDTIPNPEFDSTNHWDLGGGAGIAGGRLTLPGPDPETGASAVSSAANTNLTLRAMSDVTGVTIAGTVRARGTLTVTNGGVNTLTVTAQAYDSEGVTVGDLFATNITANASWKNYAVGPWTLTASTVAKVRFAVKQTDEESTEMLVDELRMHVAQWGEDISAEDPEQAAAFAAAVTNGMEAAKLLVRTPDLDLRTVSVPLSTNHSGGATQPTAEWYRLEATVHDYDHDRTGDALSASATTNFWLYDDDTMVPQYGSKYGGPLGVFMNGTIIPQAWRTGISSNSEISKLSQKWPITDAELTSMESNAPVTFALSFYDYSGWYTKKLLVGNSTNGFSTIQENGAVTSGAGTIGWSAPEKNDGEEEDPGATSTWSIGAKAMYTAYSNYFIGDYSESGSVMEVKAEVWDKDNDRKDDDLAFSDDGGDPRRVGYVWFADQDVWAPTWGSQTRPYSKVMLSTNVPNTAAGYAAMVNTNEGSLNPYAVGGIANNQIEDFAGRSYTIYDGELNDLNAPENDKLFAVTVNINDPLPTGEGARARKNSGLQVGSQLTDWRSMWGSPTNDTSSSDVFAVTNSYVVLAPAGGANALTNAAVNGDFSEPVSKTRVAMQAGHMSWTWASFPTNDIGKLLPGGEEASVQLTIHAYDADMNRHNDQMHAELAGPTITLRDDDTQAPTRPTDVTLTGLTLPAAGVELTRLNAPWTNNLGGVKLGFTAATDPAYTAKPGDIKTAGIARYQLAAPDVTPGVEIGSVVKEVTDQSITSYSDLSLAGIGSIDQGFGAYQLFAVDADADRPGDAMAGDAAPVPLAYDITPPTKIGVDYTKRLIADPESADDPTTQFQLSWPIAGVGPDDPEDENYIDTTYKVSRVETLSPWYSYKIYYTNYEESAIAADDDPNDDSKSWVYQTFISDPTATNYYKNWAFVMTNSPVQDPTAPKSGGRSTAYDSLGSVTANVGATNQSVRLYDLDFDQHYIVVIVGVDKAGNEGPAGMWSWATNNTIKFAVTQGVVRATAQINAMLPSDATALGNIGMKRIPLSLTPQYTPPKQGATLYWMAAGQKEEGGVRTGPVSKEYDLIYRDAPSFTEDPGKPWFMASSGRGTNVNSGTSKTNWNYHADDFSGIGRGNLRFYRASYKGRWNPSGDALPLASEEVYAMNRVPLVEGRNLVALHGVPYTNTFAGVFGTDASIFPGGSSLADATRVEFFDGQKGATLNARQSFYFVDNGGTGQWWQVNVSYPPVANPRAAANPSKEKWCERSGSEGNYFYTPSTDTSVAGNKTYYKLSEYIKLIYLDGNPSEWGLFERIGNAYVASEDTEPVEGKTYYEKGAYRYVPVDPERDVSPRMEGWFVDAGGGVYARSNDEWVQAGTPYRTRTDSPTDYSPPSGVVPMENVTDFCWDDPNFFSRGFEIVIPDLSSRPDFQTRQTTNGIADPATERNWQWGFDWYPILKVPTTNGTETATNGTFSVEVQGGGTGTDAARYTLVSLNMPVAAHPREMNLLQSGFHPGDGMMTGDAIYIWDNEAGDIRSGNVVYYNGTDWKMWQGDNPNADVPLGFFKPGDVIVIKSMSSGNWTWTYSPTNFYTLPTRHMGR